MCEGAKKVVLRAALLLTLCCAFRYLLRDLVVDYTLKKYPSWAAVDTAVSREGWKLITLLRSASQVQLQHCLP